MGFGHIYIDAPQDAVLEAMDRHFGRIGFEPFPMTPEAHPVRAKEASERDLRLFWIAPRLGRWTGLFEHRYYGNEPRERWGYTDDALASALSRDLAAEAYRLEVVDQAGFWLYARYRDGLEAAGRAYHDTPADRTLDPAHPRFELNRIADAERFPNLGLGYENVAGPQVAPLEGIPQRRGDIEGYDRFVHRAYRRRD